MRKTYGIGQAMESPAVVFFAGCETYTAHMARPVESVATSNDSKRHALAGALRDCCNASVHIDAHRRSLYATDASLYEVTPIAVVVPRQLSDLEPIVRHCTALGLPIIGRGAGTSLAGQTVGEAVIIDCSSHLDGIGNVETAHGTPSIRVEPGVVLAALVQSLGPTGLTFGPNVSTATHATMGGMIMNCSAGSHSLYYGMTDEHLLGVDVILADGTRLRLDAGADARDPRVCELTKQVIDVVFSVEDEIDRRFPKTRRNVGGYALDDLLAQARASTPGSFDRVNLARLMCGSEGTLAFLESAQLQLVPRPLVRTLALAVFASVDEAMDALSSTLACTPAAVELIDRNIIEAANEQGSHETSIKLLRGLDQQFPGAVLYIEWFSDSPSDAALNIAALRKQLHGTPGRILHVENARDAAACWAMRNEGLALVSKSQGTTIPMPGVEDCAVPAEELPAFRRAFEAMLKRHGRRALYYAHASVGLLHMRPRIDVANAEERSDFEAIGRDALALVQAHGGSISGEHGDGRIRARLVHEFYGPKLVDAFQRIKRIFDPDNRFNPGNKVLARPPMSPLRRHFALPQVIGATRTPFAYDTPGELEHAAHNCNGNGLCRRATHGAMCPSYRVTHEERHSPRGRANAVTLALRSDMPGDDESLAETLGLCLSCKACRHECPSNVDITRLKSEFLARRWAQGHVPLRERVFGPWFPTLAHLASRFSLVSEPLALIAQRSGITARLLGIAPERTMPRFVRSLQSRVRAQQRDTARPCVTLFPDCMTNTQEPDNGLAAIEVLCAFGYEVHVPRQSICCGRTALSGGFLGDARARIDHAATTLASEVARVNSCAIIVLEPSCLSAMQDEWQELPESEEHLRVQRKQVGDLARSFEGFLLEQWENHPMRPQFSSPEKPIRVHQHCHAKHTGDALGSLLARCVGAEVETLDSGCCGMAGSFGFRQEHYDVSRAIAADSLGRFLEPRTEQVLVAPGSSCRHQISECFAQTAAHPAVVLRERMLGIDAE